MKPPLARLKVMEGEALLPEIVLTLHPAGALAGALDGGQEESDQRGDDRDHHQEFDEGKTMGSGRETTGEPPRHLGCEPPAAPHVINLLIVIRPHETVPHDGEGDDRSPGWGNCESS